MTPKLKKILSAAIGITSVFVTFSFLSSYSQSDVSAPAPQQALLELRNHIEAREFFDFREESEGVWLMQDGFGKADSNGGPLRSKRGEIRFYSSRSPRFIIIELLGFLDTEGDAPKLSLWSSIDEQHVNLSGEIQQVSLALDESSDQTIGLKCSTTSSMAERNQGDDIRPICAYLLNATISLSSIANNEAISSQIGP